MVVTVIESCGATAFPRTQDRQRESGLGRIAEFEEHSTSGRDLLVVAFPKLRYSPHLLLLLAPFDVSKAFFCVTCVKK
jgi:hypothetical protein